MGKASESFNQFIDQHELVQKANQLAYRYMSVLKRHEIGKTMYNHVFDVAMFVYEAGIRNPEVVAAAFLHDIIEDSVKSVEKSPALKILITKDYLKKQFGKNVAEIVENLTNISSEKLQKQYAPKDSKKKKYDLKRMNYVKGFMQHLLAAVQHDILEHLFLIKFFDRFHNMQTLQYHGDPHKQMMIAKETLDIYIPLFYMVQAIPTDNISKMEQISFQYMYSDIYSNRIRYIEKNNTRINAEVSFIENFITDKSYKNKFEVSYQLRTPYRLHLTKSNFSGVNYAIYEITIVSDEPDPEEYALMDEETATQNRLITEKRLYDLMVDLIHHPMEEDQKFHRHYLIQNDAFKYNLNFHYSQAYMRPLPAMRITLYSNRNNIMFQLNLTTKNKLGAYRKRRNIKDWILSLQKVEEHIVHRQDTRDVYEKLRMDFLKPVTLYTPEGKCIYLPQTATLRDFAFKIHTDLGIKGTSALVNQIEAFDLNHSVKSFHGNIIEILANQEISFEEINFSQIYSEITVAISEKKANDYIKKALKEQFGKELSPERLKRLIYIFKKEVEKNF